MANPRHIEWLKEGVDAWNRRRRQEDFVPDLRGVDFSAVLSGSKTFETQLSNRITLNEIDLTYAQMEECTLAKCSLVHADLSYANLRNADLRHLWIWHAKAQRTDFRGAKLSFADFGGTILTDADMRGARLISTILKTSHLYGLDVRGTNLTYSRNLDRRFYRRMKGDDQTELPERLKIPQAWLGASHEPEDDPLLLPAHPVGHRVEETSTGLSLEIPNTELDAETLAGLFDDLREAVADLDDFGHLDNQSPLLSKGVERFLKRLPHGFDDLDQVRFGTGVQALNLQFSREKSALDEIAPEKLGHLEAVLMRASLIASHLPNWKAFREQEAEAEPIFEAQREDVEAILEVAAEALEKDPEHFDHSLFERIREYLDDATLVGYLASKDLLLNIAHRTFTLSKELTSDVLSAGRRILITGIASAFLASLASPLLRLAGILPAELTWLKLWIEHLPKLLGL